MWKKSKIDGIASGLAKSSSRTDVVCAYVRSSINNLFDVISSLDDRKKELVNSIGFSGLLEFPLFRQLNRRFVLWIMSKVDPLRQTLVIDEARKIRFRKYDVAKVFGIPCCGRSVADNGKPRTDIVATIKKQYLGIDAKDNRSIKAAQEVIERVYGDTMSEVEENAFKAAFVIYVMSTLLCPGAKFDYASVEYWNAIVNTSRISSYDWSEYVIQKLLDGVLKVKSELEQESKVPSITDHIVPSGTCFFFAWIISFFSMVDEAEFVVFDPSPKHGTEMFIDAIHIHVAKMLAAELVKLFVSIFDGWDTKLEHASLRLLELLKSPLCEINCSGLMCAYFCREFDGRGIPVSMYEMEIDVAAAIMLREVLLLRGNHGVIPTQLRSKMYTNDALY